MNIITKQSKKSVLDIETLKSHLRIDHDHEDVYLKNIIDMATEILENSIEESILEKMYKYIYYNDEFISAKKIELPIRHVNEITSVRKMLHNGSNEKILFSVENNNGKTMIITNGSKYPIEIKYKAGMTDDTSEIPNDLKYAVLQIAKNIYECSEEDILESKYIKHIINSHRKLYIN